MRQVAVLFTARRSERDTVARPCHDADVRYAASIRAFEEYEIARLCFACRNLNAFTYLINRTVAEVYADLFIYKVRKAGTVSAASADILATEYVRKFSDILASDRNDLASLACRCSATA